MFYRLHFNFFCSRICATYNTQILMTQWICRVMDTFFWRSEKKSFYSSKRWMLMRNWSKKTLFRLLVVMENNPSELISSNQQNQNQNSGQYVSCNMCQRRIKTNRGLLQHLSFCRKRNRENNINLILQLMTVTT